MTVLGLPRKSAEKLLFGIAPARTIFLKTFGSM